MTVIHRGERPSAPLPSFPPSYRHSRVGGNLVSAP